MPRSGRLRAAKVPWWRKQLLPLLGVFFVVFVIFIPLLFSKDYLYDDLEFIFRNPDFYSIRHFSDCFHFVLQPSKPITNFFLALGYLIGKGAVPGQHILSLFLHLAVGTVWYFNLLEWAKRSSAKLPGGFFLAVLFLFLVYPIHSEVLEVAQFRGEILATLFGSLAFLFSQYAAREKRRGRLQFYLGALFVCLGVAQLSKEVFALVVPPLCVLFYVLPGAKKRLDRKKIYAFAAGIFLTEIFWGAILFFLIRQDPKGHYTYSNTIGWKLVPPTAHFVLASRALMEWSLKFIGAMPFSFTRMAFRKSIGYNAPVWVYALVMATAIGSSVWLLRRKGWPAVWGGVLSAGWIYLLIPNANIGHEHYTYFCSFGFVALACLFTWTTLRGTLEHPKFVWWLAFGTCSLVLISRLETRLIECMDGYDHAQAEVERYPEYYGNWMGYLSSLIIRSAPQKEAEQALNEVRERARALNFVQEVRRDVRKAEFTYELKYGNLESVEKSFVELSKEIIDRREATFFELELASYAETRGECGLAFGVLKRAAKLGDDSKVVRATQAQLEQVMEKRPEFCVHFPKGFVPVYHGPRLPASSDSRPFCK